MEPMSYVPLHLLRCDSALKRCEQVKALALGAKGVGLGRAFLYANGTHGEEGCAKTIESE